MSYAPIPSIPSSGRISPAFGASGHIRRRVSPANISKYIAIISTITTIILAILLLQNHKEKSTYSLDAKLKEIWNEGNTRVSSGQGKNHLIDDFVKDFPVLRNYEVLGLGEVDVDEKRVKLGWNDFDWPSMRSMFVFGDSFTSNGYDPRKYGVGNGQDNAFVHLDHWLGDRAWPDWLYAQYKDPGRTKYFNFAVPGATTSWDVIRPGKEEWGTFDEQINNFKDFFTPEPGPHSVDWRRDTSLFLIYFGTNDVSHFIRTGEKIPNFVMEENCRRFAEVIFEKAERLYNLGARNFLFLNAHPYNRLPKYVLPHGVGHDVQDRAAVAIPSFNKHFELSVKKWRESHLDCNVFRFDLYRFYKLILDYPEVFGITDTERYWMSWEGNNSPTDLGRMGFMNKDFQHPTWTVHNCIARAINGYLLRQSWSFRAANASEDGLEVPKRDGDWAIP